MKRALLPNSSPQTGSDESPRTVAGAIYLRFREDILSGKLSPDAPLRSDDLRSRYSVGVSPMREALSRLVSEKLVTLSGQRGFRVASLTPEDVMDTMETRLVIEGEALSRSIMAGNVRWEASVVSTFHALSRSPLPTNDPEQVTVWNEYHKSFHMALIAGCESSWLKQMANMLFDHADRHRNVAVLGHTPKQRDPSAEHRQIMEAALSGNLKAARAALDHHYRTTADIVTRKLGRRSKNESPEAASNDKR